MINIGTDTNGIHQGSSGYTIPIIALTTNVNKSNPNPMFLIVFITWFPPDPLPPNQCNVKSIFFYSLFKNISYLLFSQEYN